MIAYFSTFLTLALLLPLAVLVFKWINRSDFWLHLPLWNKWGLKGRCEQVEQTNLQKRKLSFPIAQTRLERECIVQLRELLDPKTGRAKEVTRNDLDQLYNWGIELLCRFEQSKVALNRSGNVREYFYELIQKTPPRGSFDHSVLKELLLTIK